MTSLVDVSQAESMLLVARRNLRHFIGSASFKCEADRDAAGHCLDVLEGELTGLEDLVTVLRSAVAADARLTAEQANAAEIERLREVLGEARLFVSPGNYFSDNVREAALARIDTILNKKDAPHDD
jgi:hypothetical protein